MAFRNSSTAAAGARVARRIGAVPALCWAMLLLAPAAAPLLAAAALTHPAAPVPASAWAGLGYAGVISMFAASLAWYHGLAAGGHRPDRPAQPRPNLGDGFTFPLGAAPVGG
jgi:drug/metabolite transporter (DMT)-like permease